VHPLGVSHNRSDRQRHVHHQTIHYCFFSFCLREACTAPTARSINSAPNTY
jgi:hypothetical protein